MGFLSTRKLLRYSKALVGFRNICAHDERLYCAKIGNDGFSIIAVGILNVLGREALNDFINDISPLFEDYSGRLSVVTSKSLLSDMGFKLAEDN